MRRIEVLGASFMVLLVLGTPGLARAQSTSTTQASVSPAFAGETAVLTRKGISPARASQAISLQAHVAETHLASTIEAALGAAFAGAWFEPAAAQFHVGVTSDASRQSAQRVLAHSGLMADVVETPVRSTWAALIAAQNRWNNRLATLFAHQEAKTGIDSKNNAVAVDLSSSVPAPERTALEREAATASVNVSITAVSPSQLQIEPKAKPTECEYREPNAEARQYNGTGEKIKTEAYCEKTITSGVKIAIEPFGCTAGPMLIEGNATYLLTAGHCFVEEFFVNGDATTGNKVITGIRPGRAGETQAEAEAKITNLKEWTKAPATAVVKASIFNNEGEKLTTTVKAFKSTTEVELLAAWTGKPGPVGITFSLTEGKITREVSSEYLGKEGQKKIGNEVTFFKNEARDIAEIKIERGAFTEPEPDPVPADMVEWGNWHAYPEEPITPLGWVLGLKFNSHPVAGDNPSMEGMVNCHEGETSGEQCGTVEHLNVRLAGSSAELTTHLVEDSACAEHGDSGGPYFFRAKSGVLMEGTEVGGPSEVCSKTGKKGAKRFEEDEIKCVKVAAGTGKYNDANCTEEGGVSEYEKEVVYRPEFSVVSYFEPLVGLPGAAKEYGTLETFKGQAVLTTKNEKRKKPKPELDLDKDGYPIMHLAGIVGDASDLALNTAIGDVECASNVLTGDLTANEGTKLDTVSFSEESSTGEEAEGDCRTTTGLGRAAVSAGGLPWQTELTTKGKTVIKGTKEVLMTVTLPEAGGAKCQFTSKKVTGSFTPGPAGEPTPLKVAISEQRFTLNKKFGENSPKCPTEAKLSATLAFTSELETVEDQVT